jgi:hypothetical protein
VHQVTGHQFVQVSKRACFVLFSTGQYFEPFYIEIHIQDEKIRVRIFQELTIKPNVF